jgi:hypothetical protein
VSLVALVGVGVGALALVGAIAWALLRKPRLVDADAGDQTVAFEPIGPADGDLVKVAGRVAVERPVYAPSGAPCALYEIYAGAGDEPARALRRQQIPFSVDDGTQAVRIVPASGLVAFDLPAEALDPQEEGTVVIERKLEPGARVQVVGRVRRVGAPGHEILVLEPPPGTNAVPLTWLSA